MPLLKADLKALLKQAYIDGKALGEDGDEDAIADLQSEAVADWLHGYQPNVVAVLSSPSGPVTGTITITIQVT
ncbi:MAG: hypothetical protein RIE86_09105 [Imperialibacter sp.]|uniref:hypothetical protein n=1 Tax=Imperialibacter sp. TaxID=2038411 RepID=UPI0032EFF39C